MPCSRPPTSSHYRRWHVNCAPKICIKYRKHGSSSFSHTFNCVCFSLFLIIFLRIFLYFSQLNILQLIIVDSLFLSGLSELRSGGKDYAHHIILLFAPQIFKPTYGNESLTTLDSDPGSRSRRKFQ